MMPRVSRGGGPACGLRKICHAMVEPKFPRRIQCERLFQRENKMRNMLIAAL